MNWIQAIIQAIINAFKPKPPTPPQPSPPPPQNWHLELLILMNQARSKNMVGELRIDEKLNQAAQNHSNWMHANNKLSHDENGSPFTNRLNAVNYNWSAAGENIAQGYQSVQSVFNGWMNSSGHRANILNSRYVDVGFGWTGTFWTADFGRTAFSEVHLSGPLEF